MHAQVMPIVNLLFPKGMKKWFTTDLGKMELVVQCMKFTRNFQEASEVRHSIPEHFMQTVYSRADLDFRWIDC
jgi:hypothetical protein